MPNKDIEKRRAYQREWAKKHPKYSAGKSREWKKNNPNYHKDYQVKNGKKIYLNSKLTGQAQATWKVWNAIIKGDIPDLKKIFINCHRCPERAICYDHRDYNFPLLVTPVCHSCNLLLGKAIPVVQGG